MRTLSLLGGFVVLFVPILARSAPMKNTVEAFPIGRVTLLDGPCKQAMERNAAYLLSVDADRLLHNTRQSCGLPPKGALYGGWEARGIAGHSLGHYLSALAEQYAATGDRRFHDRIEYIVGEMALCQQRYGDGYIGALPPLELQTLRDFKKNVVRLSGSFNFAGGAWVPWYTEHKILAGLKDAWTLGGCAQAKEVTLRLADFVDAVTAGLSPKDVQTMLGVEFGGMNETLLEIHALTGEARYLAASRRFYHEAVMNPLAQGKDELPGKHANMQIPKVIGEAVRYEVTGEENGRRIAENFWNIVTGRYLFANGGNSDREHFFQPDKAAEHLGPETAETCNTYNMLKLTAHLMRWKPTAAYGDFYEKALYNHILASQEPEHGMFTYFVSLKPGLARTYSTPDKSFWCCVGTGMENHTKYGEAIYFHNAGELYVNLFIPSALSWPEKGLALRQTTAYPNEGQTELAFQTAPPAPLALLVRCPAWATGPLAFQLNGQPIEVNAAPGTFARVERTWKSGDRLTVSIPMGLRTEALQGAPNKQAILYGPLLLAGDLGPVPRTATYPLSADHTANERNATADVPVLIAADAKALLKGIERVTGPTPVFHTVGLGQPKEVTLRPLKDIPYNYYNVYWDVLSAEEWDTKRASIESGEAAKRQETARLVDELAPGEQQSETDHGLTSERSRTGDLRDRKWRDCTDGGFFAFRLKVLADTPQVLRVTYWGGEAGQRNFRVLVDGQLLARQTLNRNQPGEFFNVETPLPPALLAGKKEVTVRFEPEARNVAGGIFHCAVMKTAAP